MNLQLSLKTKWFNMTNSGIKKEDYREITPYWASQLLSYWNEKKSKAFWEEKLPYYINIMEQKPVSSNHFTTNTITLGYPKKGDSERIIEFEHAGIEIRTGNPEWGAEPGKLYFVIKHGKRI